MKRFFYAHDKKNISTLIEEVARINHKRREPIFFYHQPLLYETELIKKFCIDHEIKIRDYGFMEKAFYGRKEDLTLLLKYISDNNHYNIQEKINSITLHSF